MYVSAAGAPPGVGAEQPASRPAAARPAPAAHRRIDADPTDLTSAALTSAARPCSGGEPRAGASDHKRRPHPRQRAAPELCQDLPGAGKAA
ncbi:hypothetical protein GCM10022419_041690 [Nonomuraea rosea]|uniref:Uncharacterized protein n=1 Tax=Nonomuraea rosea TaxID=638574 RepID=A0ABP6WUB3_9ACTN